MTDDAIDPAQADLLARLDAACPGFAPYPSSEGLAYMLIGDFVRHVIAAHLHDATAQLALLSDDLLSAPLARADHVSSPLSGRGAGPVEPLLPPPPGNRECGFVQRHPCCVRIIPKSRDFH